MRKAEFLPTRNCEIGNAPDKKEKISIAEIETSEVSLRVLITHVFSIGLATKFNLKQSVSTRLNFVQTQNFQ